MAARLFISVAERRNRITVALAGGDHTMAWLADKAGYRTYSAFANRLKAENPGLDTLKRIARALGVTVGFLVDR